MARRRGAEGRRRAGDLAAADRAGARGPRGAPGARHRRMPGRRPARASRRTARRAARAPRAARPRGLRLRPRDRCRRALRHGAPARARPGSVSFARPLLLLALGLLPLWWWLRAKRLGRLPGPRIGDVRPAAGSAERLLVGRLPLTL